MVQWYLFKTEQNIIKAMTIELRFENLNNYKETYPFIRVCPPNLGTSQLGNHRATKNHFQYK